MKKKIYAILLIIAVLAVLLTPCIVMFTITDVKSGKVVYLKRVSEVEEFNIEFIHSVNRKPVYEYYRITDKKFVVYKTEFYSYGAGMPEYEDYGEKPYLKNGMVNIDNLNIKMESFKIFVGTIANHTVNTKNESIILSQLIRPGDSALFKIEKVSFYLLLRGKIYD